jgi:magnesium-protoporphyrin IX monomethyl ester (oxidative) cyclase
VAFRVSRGLMGGFGMAVHPDLMYPPIELAHVASVLEAAGHTVAMIDADAAGLSAETVVAAVMDEAPALICLDSSSTSLILDLAVAGALRRASGAVVAILGSQVTYTPGEIFADESVDVVVRGEPEYIVRDVAERVASWSNGRKGDENGAGPAKTFEGVAGTTWKRGGGEIVHEPAPEKIADLDELPPPARHLLDNEAYTFPGLDGPVTTVKSSRGCPYDCSFCGYTLAQGLRFRFRSPENVVAELVELSRRFGLRHVVFRDPIFTTRKDRVHAICEGIVREGLDLAWQCETAVKTLDPPLLKAMAAAGCTHISLGVESGDVGIQKKFCGNKLNDHDQAQEVFDACRRVGIETRAFCMLGFPGETRAMIETTYDLVERLDPDQVQFCAVTAYPGTPLYEELNGAGRLDYAAMTGVQALEGNEHLTADEINGLIREGYRRFYRRPKRLAREIRHPLRLAGRIARYMRLRNRGA